VTEEEVLSKLSIILEKVLAQPTSIEITTDLIEDKILDSLDGMVFLLEVEQAFDKGFPEDIDLVSEGYYKIEKLVTYLRD